jgi:tRNA pseudouridine13 synthase
MKETMDSELGVTVNLFKKVQDRDLAIYGDYRKLICRPKDFDFDIKEYYDPLQPLIQTDLMKLDGDNIEIQPKKEENEKVKVAMIVGFSLPSSSYATIALRELTKKPTSNEYQMELKL